jgi:hypothetical protein
VWLKRMPGPIGPESKERSVAVQVCVTESWLTTVTTVPALIVTVIGLKAKLWMLIVTRGGTVVVVVGAAVVVVTGATMLVVEEVLDGDDVVVLVEAGAVVDGVRTEVVGEDELGGAGREVAEVPGAIRFEEGDELPHADSESAVTVTPIAAATSLVIARVISVPSRHRCARVGPWKVIRVSVRESLSAPGTLGAATHFLAPSRHVRGRAPTWLAAYLSSCG